ncbi:T9SS type A sorting domain-containing protein [Aureitalea sp. L0-47]|uniref:T9SS type A sorting domain-containing protein n=1 Tax=Aureitalea sp. L0-47 TaxID=2816962 RepID=UPI00223879B9|nr:T9SS type A sorting domain-containing protein [Aureitalea sp. L0-47]MCW5518358.1 T9SS type A sorting domain-containing protein [Aureitalea sp. L0-47]
MKRSILIVILIIATTSTWSQELVRSTVGVSGASSTVQSGNKTYVVQQSVGQSSVIGLYASDNYALRQGFIQPPIRILSVGSENKNPIDAVIFPNPFASDVRIVFNESLEGKVEITIYDMLGRVVHTRAMAASKEINLELSFLSSAQYVLLLTSNNREFKANILKE